MKQQWVICDGLKDAQGFAATLGSHNADKSEQFILFTVKLERAKVFNKKKEAFEFCGCKSATGLNAKGLSLRTLNGMQKIGK